MTISLLLCMYFDNVKLSQKDKLNLKPITAGKTQEKDGRT